MEPYNTRERFSIKRPIFFIEPKNFDIFLSSDNFFLSCNKFFCLATYFFLSSTILFFHSSLINEKLWSYRALESLTFQKFSSVDTLITLFLIQMIRHLPINVKEHFLKFHNIIFRDTFLPHQCDLADIIPKPGKKII